MSTAVQIPDIQLINLTYLLAIVTSACRNPAQTCYRFNLEAADVHYIQSLSIDKIQALVANLDQCLFVVRRDLLRLIDAPAGLASVLSAVRGAPDQDGPPRRTSGSEKPSEHTEGVPSWTRPL